MNEANENVFETYFSGQLNEADKTAFEDRLENDADLAEDFQFFLAVKKATHLKGRDDLRAQLSVIKEKPTPTTKVISIWKKIIPLAAVLLLTFIAYKINTSELKSVDQYAQHFEQYSPSTSRSVEDKDLGLDDFNNENYQGYLNVTKGIEGDSEVYILQAMAHIHLEDFDKANERLLMIDDGTSLRNQKYWYLGLNAIKRNNAQEAIRHFEHLQAISNYKKTEVQEILDQLKNQ